MCIDCEYLVFKVHFKIRQAMVHSKLLFVSRYVEQNIRDRIAGMTRKHLVERDGSERGRFELTHGKGWKGKVAATAGSCLPVNTSSTYSRPKDTGNINIAERLLRKG